jgi:hypothetical protein
MKMLIRISHHITNSESCLTPTTWKWVIAAQATWNP